MTSNARRSELRNKRRVTPDVLSPAGDDKERAERSGAERGNATRYRARIYASLDEQNVHEAARYAR
jgi:hypothetical protein